MLKINVIISIGLLSITPNIFSQATHEETVMNWERYKQYSHHLPELGFTIDISRMNFSALFMDEMKPKMQEAFTQMEALEGGAIANPDEKRMVGHYWLRDSKLAPSTEIMLEIKDNRQKIADFVTKVREGKIKGIAGAFKRVLVIGIGGSALGPQFVGEALYNHHNTLLKPYFIDNTDPDGIDMVLAELAGKLGETMTIVISKSGGTKETHNGMMEVKRAYEKAGLKFEAHAVAITGEDSKLDVYAAENNWIERFPLWDWVGGRTSELSAVGLVPAALQGINIEDMLMGARMMDQATRLKDIKRNPAAMLALMWYHATGGKGNRDMVILPYKDRLKLFSKYLQQLVMESIGKEKDLKGNVVNQGIAVYGNKGSTDQHAYVQQLRDGVNNFFVTFIEVLKDRNGEVFNVEPDTTAGDYLEGFLIGTRDALTQNKRESITITVETVSPFTVGALIALYERAVGYYATLVGINAYHQPGVEAGKKAATDALALNGKIYNYLRAHAGKAFTAESLASSIQEEERTEHVFRLLEHLAANSDKKVVKQLADHFHNSTYMYKGE